MNRNKQATFSAAKTLNTNRYQFAKEKLIKHVEKNGKIFDIGSGDGCMEKIVKDAGFTWCGFDISPQTDHITEWDLKDPCPQGEASCDGILLLEVIEHLPNLGSALKNVRSALKNGGILILSVPNPRWSKSRLHALRTGYLSCFTQEDLELNYHVFTPWPHIVEKMLKDAGFRVIEYCLIEGPTRIWPKNMFSPCMPFRLVGNLICRMIEKLDPTACGMSYGMVAKAT